MLGVLRKVIANSVHQGSSKVVSCEKRVWIFCQLTIHFVEIDFIFVLLTNMKLSCKVQ